jgi:integrase
MARPKLTVAKYGLHEDVRGIWHVTWTDTATGKTRKRSTGERNETAARAMMPDIKREVENAPAPSTYTVGEMLEAYKADRTLRPHSPSFPHTINALIRYFGAWRPEQLHGDKVWSDYRVWRTGQDVVNAGALASKSGKKKVKDVTAVRELNALRGALSWATRNGYKGLETVDVHLPDSGGTARQRFLTKPEVEKLIAACIEPHTKLFVLLSLATGARMSAVLSLTWDDVTFPAMGTGEGPNDHTKSFIDYVGDVVQGKRPQLVDVIALDMGQGRHNKRRGLGVISPTNWRLWTELVRAWDRRTYFVEHDELHPEHGEVYVERICDYVISYRNKKLGKVDLTDAYRRAGIVGATQHTLRHTTISWLVQAGQTYESIGKLVGVSPKIIESNYGHMSPKHLATVGDVLSV